MLRAEDRLFLVDVDGGETGSARAQRGLERAALDQFGAAGVHDQRIGLHACEVRRRDDAARRVVEPHVQRQHVALRKQCALTLRDVVIVLSRARLRSLAAPHQHVHPECAAVARHETADLAVAEDALRPSAYGRAEAMLPTACAQMRRLLRNAPHRRKHQRPRQLGRRIRRARSHRHTDPAARAGLDVDVTGPLAGLTDEPQTRKAREQLVVDDGPLADEHERVGIAEPLLEGGPVFDGVVEDRHVVSTQLRETIEPPHGVLIVVRNDDVHVYFFRNFFLRAWRSFASSTECDSVILLSCVAIVASSR